jgi:hypothetical protein
MKLDLDCVRDVLLRVESLEYGNHPRFKSFCVLLPEYGQNLIACACLRLNEAGYLNIIKIDGDSYEMPIIHQISDITFEGHEFLSNIREDSIWKTVKSRTAEVGGSVSLSVLSSLALAAVRQTLGM